MPSRDELIRRIRKIQEGTYSSENEADANIEELTNNVIDPSVLDYIFDIQYEHLSGEEIADKIMEYKPIRL